MTRHVRVASRPLAVDGAAAATPATAATAIQIAMARNSGRSVSRAQIGCGGREIGEPPEPLQPERRRVARVERQPAAIHDDDNRRGEDVSTSEIAASTRVARRVASVQATAAGTANSGSTGAKNRAGGLQPPHHIAKCVTVSRYGVITNSSSSARRREARPEEHRHQTGKGDRHHRRIGDEAEALIEQQAAEAAGHEGERSGVAPGPYGADGSGRP